MKTTEDPNPVDKAQDEELCQYLLDLMEEGIIRIDAAGIVSFADDTMASLTGYQPGEIVGRRFESLYADQEAERATAIWNRVRGGGREKTDIIILRKDMRPIYAIINMAAIHDDSGTFLGAMALVSDITEVQQYQDSLEMANKKLNLLSSITRHDILNTLTAVFGYCELTRDILPDDPELQKNFSKIEEAVGIVRKQIEFTRDYQDIGVKPPVWQDIASIICNAARVVPPGEITVDCSVNDLEVYADPLLQKIFSNLFDNAIRHGKTVKTIVITFTADNGDGLLVFEDDGEGIPDQMKSKLFRRGVGTNAGFGLFISREILGITGITITENGEKRTGARFEIRIPRDKFRVMHEESIS
jgi:PAS domain S-box-containing protein